MPARLNQHKTADVVVVGGGPSELTGQLHEPTELTLRSVGLLVAYQLARFGVEPYIVEQEDKPNAPVFGRATTAWCRSLELLDALGLADNLLARGVISKTGVNFRQ